MARKKTEKKKATTQILPEGSKKDKDSHQHARDLVLKITASYLLQKKYTEEEQVYFNQVDLTNWLVLEKANVGSSGLNVFRYGKDPEPVPLFNLTTISNNVTKLKVHPEWIKNFWLVRAEEIKNLKPGLIYYIDQGAGEYLKKCIAN